MALRTRDDIFLEVLVRSNRATTDAFVTDAMLKNWFVQAHTWAAGAHKWPATEGRVQTTYTAVEEWNFEGYKADSFRIVTIGGKRLQKLNYDDYLLFKEAEPSATDRVYSDFGRTLFINSSVDASGTLVCYGQFTPQIDLTDETGLTVFSGFDEEGNEAIVERMLAYYYSRQSPSASARGGKVVSESIVHQQEALTILERLWQRILDEQAMYQTARDRGGMFRRFSVLSGLQDDELWRRDQW